MGKNTYILDMGTFEKKFEKKYNIEQMR